MPDRACSPRDLLPDRAPPDHRHAGRGRRRGEALPPPPPPGSRVVFLDRWEGGADRGEALPPPPPLGSSRPDRLLVDPPRRSSPGGAPVNVPLPPAPPLRPDRVVYRLESDSPRSGSGRSSRASSPSGTLWSPPPSPSNKRRRSPPPRSPSPGPPKLCVLSTILLLPELKCCHRCPVYQFSLPKGYKDAIMEAQALRVNYGSESKKCEALESHIADLRRDNERLRKLYTETLFKFTNQVKFHTECQNLKEELGKANSRLLSMEEEYKKEIEQLKHDSEMNCNALESKLSCALAQRATDEATIGQLKSDLGAHKAHIDMLGGRLEQVTAEVHMQYKNDIQDLNDVIMVEQEEKNDVQRKLKSAENELRIMKMKQAEQQRDSVSVQHVEALKQKVMKLRKENESLKRRLASSELDCS